MKTPADRRRSPCLFVASLLAALVGSTAPVKAARADIRVEVRGVDNGVQQNVLAYLSLQRYSKVKDISSETVARLEQRAPREVRQALRPFGYYEPEVRTTVTQDGDKWQAKIDVTPGKPVMLREVTVAIDGPGRDDPLFTGLATDPALAVGQQLNHGAYDGVKGQLLRVATSKGYLDSRFTRSQLLVDPEQHAATATIDFDTGARYRFGETVIAQDVLDPRLVRRFLRYDTGDWYDAETLLRTQLALDDSQYFSVVEVLPGGRDKEALTVPVNIRAEPIKRDKYTAAVGYATDTRWRGSLAWENRRVNTRGHRLRIEGRVTSIGQALETKYVIPWRDPALEKLSIEGLIGRTELADVETHTIATKIGLTQIVGNWQRVMSLSANRAVSQTTEGSTTDTLVVPGVSFTHVPRGFNSEQVLNTGFFGELIGSTTVLGSRSSFLRLRLQDNRWFTLAPKWRLQLRGQLGATAVKDIAEVPAEYRFFAGGDNSVRGFGLYELSPTDADGLKTGGKYLIVGSVEVERALPRNFAVAAFVDAGNALNSFSDPLEYSAGIGLRFKLPFISVGFDVAQPLSEPGAKPRIHINIAPVF